MRELKEEEIKEMKGGFAISTWIAIGAGAVLIAGILDGFCRPLKCN